MKEFQWIRVGCYVNLEPEDGVDDVLDASHLLHCVHPENVIKDKFQIIHIHSFSVDYDFSLFHDEVYL